MAHKLVLFHFEFWGHHVRWMFYITTSNLRYSLSFNLRLKNSRYWAYVTITQHKNHKFLSHLYNLYKNIILQMYRYEKKRTVFDRSHMWITVRYRLRKYPRPHTRISRKLYVDYACEFLAATRMCLIIQSQLREIAASVQKTAAKYSRNLTDQRMERKGRGEAVRGFMRSRHLRVWGW